MMATRMASSRPAPGFACPPDDVGGVALWAGVGVAPTGADGVGVAGTRVGLLAAVGVGVGDVANACPELGITSRLDVSTPLCFATLLQWGR